MLTQIRGMFKGNVGRIVVPFIIALVVLAFAFVGVPELRNFTQPSAITVGSQKIDTETLRTEFTRQIDYYRQQTGESLTTEEARAAGLLDAAIETLTTKALLEQEADNLGITITNEQITEFLQNEPAFQNPNTGRFDQQVLIAILQNNRLTLDEFRTLVRSDVLRNQLLGSLGAPIPAPSQWVELQLKRQAEARQITFVRLTASENEVGEPTEEQLQAYYDSNEEAYQAPEYRTFRAVILRNEDFSEGLERSEDELRQLFEVRRQMLSTPETRTVRQLTYQTEAEAEAAFNRLQDGIPFEQLAEEQGFPLERVTFEGVTRDDLTDPTIADALFSTDRIGEPIGPIDGILGNTVAEVLEITPGQDAVFEEERETLEAELTENETARRMYDAVEAIEIARDEGIPLIEAVNDVPQAELVEYGPVSRDLFTPDGAVVEDLPVEVLNEAFLLEEGDETQMIDLADNAGYYAVILDVVRAPAVRPFEEVRAEVRSAWLQERRRELVDARIEELRAAYQDADTLTAAAQAIGTTAVSTSLSPQSNPQNLPQPFIQTLYEADLNAFVTAWGPNGTTGYAGIVRDVSFPAIGQQAQLIDLYRQSLGQQIAMELQQAYLSELQAELDVKQNPQEIERLFNFGTQ